MTDSMLIAALAAAQRGFRVFPLQVGGKLPVLKEWPDLATTNEDQIRNWWGTRYAGCNVGICPGERFVIIDVDTGEGHASCGLAALQELIRQGLPKTLTVRTPSGGLHLYYQHPGQHSPERRYIKSVAAWRRGIDIRGNRGQGVAPGSTIDGVPYVVETAMAPAQLPENIAAALPYKELPKSIPDAIPEYLRGRQLSDDTSLEVVTESPYSTFPDVIPMGKRDSTLFGYACSWRERGYPEAHAHVLMRELLKRCEQGDDPITEEQAAEKVVRAYQTYKAGARGDWTALVAPDNTVVEAPMRQVADLKAALERFLFVEAGNRVVDTLRHPFYAVLKLDEFKNSFRNVKLEFTPEGKNKPVKVPLAEAWLSNKARQTVRDVGYQPFPMTMPEPGATYKYLGEIFYNTWRGTELETVETPDKDKVAPFFEHIRYLFGNDVPAMRLFMDWMFFTVQQPHVRISYAALIVGRQGLGKSWLGQLLSKLLGSKNVAMVTTEDLDSGFNGWIYQKTCAVIDEIAAHGRKDLIEKLKATITEPEREINIKYGAKQTQRIFANVLAFSNHMDAAAIAEDDRRFWVFHSQAKQRSPKYYAQLFNWLHTDGPSHLLAVIRDADLSKFIPGARPPMTRAKAEMIHANMDEVERTIKDAIEARDGVFQFDIVSAQLAERFVLTALGGDRVDPRQRSLIQRTLANLGPPLPQAQYRVKGAKTAVRLKCVRNFERWCGAKSADIVAEYTNALEASMTSKFAVIEGGKHG